MLDEVAASTLLHHAAAEPLVCLYRQPDRAIFLAERAAIVLKVYADGTTLRHEWMMTRRACAAGVPIPEQLGFWDGPPAVIAMRRVVGQPISAEAPRAAREVGRLLARFHRLGASPPFSTGESRWDRHILTWAGRELIQMERLGAIDAAAIAALRAYFKRQAPLLTDRPVALLHGDLQPDHALVNREEGRVAAFLDFADAQPGDPLLDLAVLTLREDALVSPLLAGYGAVSDGTTTRALLATYRLLRRVSEVPWLLARGYGDEATENIIAIRRLLAEL